MTGSQTSPSLTRQTIEEHRQINFYLDQLERSLAGLVDIGADVEPMRRMAARIEGLRERLVEHFASEEDGLFRALGEAIPPVRGALMELAGQHGRILSQLEMSRIRAQYGSGDAEARLLRADLASFLRLVRKHETEEDALFARAVPSDPPA